MQKIANTLNRNGLTTAQGKSFKRMQVKRILDRRAIYEGRYRYSGIEANGKHEPIL
jgi:site-specific DNA recombinase